MSLRRLSRRWTNNFDTGWYVSYCFDRAVTFWGVYVENRLNELDDQTRAPKYTLDDLIGEPKRQSMREAADAMRAIPGAIRRGTRGLNS